LNQPFEKRRGGARNEPLDTWVYTYTADHHLELRLHRRNRAEYEAAHARFSTAKPAAPAAAQSPQAPLDVADRTSDAIIPACS